MKRETEKDSFRFNLLPTEDKVSGFTTGSLECCTADNFRPDLRRSPRSLWNKSASRVFALYFNDCQQYATHPVPLIAEYFLAHLKQLQRQFNLMNLDEGSKENIARRRRRTRRKYSVELDPYFSPVNIY